MTNFAEAQYNRAKAFGKLDVTFILGENKRDVD